MHAFTANNATAVPPFPLESGPRVPVNYVINFVHNVSRGVFNNLCFNLICEGFYLTCNAYLCTFMCGRKLV